MRRSNLLRTDGCPIKSGFSPNLLTQDSVWLWNKKETMISIHKKIFQYRMVRRNTSWEVSIGWSQDRTIAELIAKLEPTQYRNNICYNQKGKPMLYIQLKKALYGMLQATLVFWNYCLWCNRSGGSRSMSTITALWTRQPLASNVQYYGMLTI